MSGMFSRCSYIPDISNWNTSNVKKMKYMFNEFISSPINFKMEPFVSTMNNQFMPPDIIKNNPNNYYPGIHNMDFNMNSQYSVIPDISRWNTHNVIDMSGMFRKCLYIPDISKWNTSNDISMSHMFSLCKNIPDISKWNTSNVINMGGMFIGCSSIPDISKYNTNNVTNMCYMFSECSSIPDISK